MQQCLFDPYREQLAPEAKARALDPSTSRHAARSVDVRGHRKLVLDTLRAWSGPPPSAAQLAAALAEECSAESVRGRLNELWKLAQVMVAGTKRNRRGRLVRTWKARQPSTQGESL